jgi:alpha-galactosidase
VGLFNRGPEATKVTVRWADLGLKGKHRVRDLWAHKDLGRIKDQFSTAVPSHGVVLLRIGK